MHALFGFNQLGIKTFIDKSIHKLAVLKIANSDSWNFPEFYSKATNLHTLKIGHCLESDLDWISKLTNLSSLQIEAISCPDSMHTGDFNFCAPFIRNQDIVKLSSLTNLTSFDNGFYDRWIEMSIPLYKIEAAYINRMFCSSMCVSIF